jgi:hypothetical protein
MRIYVRAHLNPPGVQERHEEGFRCPGRRHGRLLPARRDYAKDQSAEQGRSRTPGSVRHFTGLVRDP